MEDLILEHWLVLRNLNFMVATHKWSHSGQKGPQLLQPNGLCLAHDHKLRMEDESNLNAAFQATKKSIFSILIIEKVQWNVIQSQSFYLHGETAVAAPMNVYGVNGKPSMQNTRACI